MENHQLNQVISASAAQHGSTLTHRVVYLTGTDEYSTTPDECSKPVGIMFYADDGGPAYQETWLFLGQKVYVFPEVACTDYTTIINCMAVPDETYGESCYASLADALAGMFPDA